MSKTHAPNLMVATLALCTALLLVLAFGEQIPFHSRAEAARSAVHAENGPVVAR